MVQNTAIKAFAPAQTMWESDSGRYCVVEDTYLALVSGFDILAGTAPVVVFGRPGEIDVKQVAADWFARLGDG